MPFIDPVDRPTGPVDLRLELTARLASAVVARERWSECRRTTSITIRAQRALARHQSRYDLLCFGTPPEFGEPILRVEQETPGKCWVYVPEGLIGGEARYAMVYEGGAWKAAFKEVDVALTGKWKRWLDL